MAIIILSCLFILTFPCFIHNLLCVLLRSEQTLNALLPCSHDTLAILLMAILSASYMNIQNVLLAFISA